MILLFIFINILIGELYLKFFELSDQVDEAKQDNSMDPAYFKRLLMDKRRCRNEILRLEKELAPTINREEDQDSTENEIDEKWKLVK